ncbi:MAG TPA: tetratricopeptide repeat protein [Vicinamibacteria bacterium]
MAPKVKKSDDRFFRADAYRDKGDLKRAFRIFLAAAKDGDVSSQVNVGYFYDEGLGVKANPGKARCWYMRAYRRGDAAAATNIGINLRSEGKWRQALRWFEKAVELGNDDAALDIAQTLLSEKGSVPRAVRYLKRVVNSDNVSEASKEAARKLLRKYRQPKKK